MRLNGCGTAAAAPAGSVACGASLLPSATQPIPAAWSLPATPGATDIYVSKPARSATAAHMSLAAARRIVSR